MNLFPLNPHICPPPAILGSSYRFREQSSSVLPHNIKIRIPNLILDQPSPLTRKSELCVAMPAPFSSIMATTPTAILTPSKTPAKKRARQDSTIQAETRQETISLSSDRVKKIEHENTAKLKKLHSIKLLGLTEELSTVEINVIEMLAKKSFSMEAPTQKGNIVRKEVRVVSVASDRVSPTSVCTETRMHAHSTIPNIPKEKWVHILEDLKTPKGQTLKEYATKIDIPINRLTDGLRKRGIPVTQLYKNKILNGGRACHQNLDIYKKLKETL